MPSDLREASLREAFVAKYGERPKEYYEVRMPSEAEEWDMKLEVWLACAKHLDAPTWQPIETAPTDGTRILLGNKHGAWIGIYEPVYTSGYRPSNPWASMMLNHEHMAVCDTNPTHWMPLPAAPIAAIAATKGEKDAE